MELKSSEESDIGPMELSECVVLNLIKRRGQHGRTEVEKGKEMSEVTNETFDQMRREAMAAVSLSPHISMHLVQLFT